MISEKDEILKAALEELLAIRIEGAIYNNDHLNYWFLLNENISQISTCNLITGIANFKRALLENANSRELLSYHLRLMTRLSNNEMVVAGTNNLFQSFSTMAEHYNSEYTEFDLFDVEETVEVNLYDRILMVFHICQDLLDANFLAHKLKYDEVNTASRKPRRGMIV